MSEQILHSFNKMAESYADSSHLQNQVARILLDFCDEFFSDVKIVLDLGAGSGNVAKNITHKIDSFIALDNAPNLLSLHPLKLDNIASIRLVECDFERYDFSERYDLIIASSALQWAKDLDTILQKIANTKNARVAFAIFTNASLWELHSFLGTKSPLKSADEVVFLAQKYFDIDFKVESFHLNFSSREAFLSYLKGCALLGGGHLNFSEKKRFRFEIPYFEANFEVLFIKGSVK